MAQDNKYAMLIGVGEDLPVTVKDAQALYDHLTDPSLGDYDPKNVFLHLHQDAGKKSVVTRMKELIKITKEDPEATVIVYYSGHGGLVEKHDGTMAYYLFTHGYDEYDPEGTMLHGNTFSWMVNNMQCEKLLVLLDCCHADGMEDEGKVFTKRVHVDAERGNSMKSELLRKLKQGQGRVFVSSCKDHQSSLIIGDTENSLFTEVILEAINGMHTDEEDEFVPVIDLIVSVLKKVPKRAEKAGQEQHPVLSNADDLDAHFHVCQNRNWIGKRRDDSGTPVNYEEKLQILNHYVDKIDPAEVIQDIQELVNDEVSQELINDVTKLLEENTGFFSKLADIFRWKR